MKIVIVTGIFPPDIGGPATYVPLLADALASRGHQVQIITLSNDTSHDDRMYSFEVLRIPRGQPRLVRWIRTLKLVARVGSGVDLLFVCGLAFETVVANLIIRKPLVIRVVGDMAWERSQLSGLCIQDFETFQRKSQPFWTRVVQILQKWWISRADAVVVPSHFLARWVAGSAGADKIAIVRNAVDLEAPVKTCELPLRTEINVITVGRLVPWKRVDGIVGAIATLDGVGLVVVGDGPERSALETLAETLGIRDRVFFAGQQDKDGVRCLLGRCDIFALNSTYEGLPFVLLEAMESGVSVVATAVGGVPEIVRDEENGILVDVSGGELAIALRRLVESNSLRERLAVNAQNFVRGEFGWPQILDQTEILLRRTAGRTAVP